MSKTLWTPRPLIDANERIYDDPNITYDQSTITYDGVVQADITPNLTAWTAETP